MRYLCLLIVMMTTVVLMAADPVGRVTSSGPLTLNGKAVPATAVSSLPVVAGDEIATSSSSAMIYFTDKSRATIEPNSRVKLEARSSSVALRVLSGSVDLKRAEGSRVSLIQPFIRWRRTPPVSELLVSPSPHATKAQNLPPATRSTQAAPPTPPPHRHHRLHHHREALIARPIIRNANRAILASGRNVLLNSVPHDNPFEKIGRPESVLV